MIDLNLLAAGAVEIFRHHSPWLAEKLAAGAVSQAVKEAWDQVKRILTSPGGQETIQRVEAQPDKDRNWDTLKNHLMDALEQDPALRDQLAGLVASQPVHQRIHGDGNKQAAILGSPGASIKL